MSQWKACRLAVALIAAVSLGEVAEAQRDAGAKARGEFGTGFWSSRRVGRSIRHAREYSADLYRYSGAAHVVQPEVAKSESEQLGRTIDGAAKELGSTAGHFANDKEVKAALDMIGKHIANAAEMHKRLHEECCKDAPNRGTTMHCCSEVTKELEKAAAEHAALMRKFEQRAMTNSHGKQARANSR